jgi:hypothetical protein
VESTRYKLTILARSRTKINANLISRKMTTWSRCNDACNSNSYANPLNIRAEEIAYRAEKINLLINQSVFLKTFEALRIGEDWKKDFDRLLKDKALSPFVCFQSGDLLSSPSAQNPINKIAQVWRRELQGAFNSRDIVGCVWNGGQKRSDSDAKVCASLPFWVGSLSRLCSRLHNHVEVGARRRRGPRRPWRPPAAKFNRRTSQRASGTLSCGEWPRAGATDAFQTHQSARD